jgi:LPXTG-motif cell wall-anchored protein
LKKFLIALLAALLVVGMFTVAVAEVGDQFPDGEVSADKDPADPGLDPLPSAPEGGTETDPTTVTITSETCQHTGNTHTEVVFQGSPICTATRAEVTFCDACGQPISTTYLKPIGHDPDLSQTKIITPATCVTSGQQLVWCKRCNQYVDLVDWPGYTAKTMAPGHRFDKGTEVRKATCVDHGVIKYVCLDCGEIVEEETPMINHSFNMKARTTIVIQRANCEQVGGYQAVCLTCGGIFQWTYGPDDHTDAPKYIAGAHNAAGQAVEPVVTASSPRGTKVLRIVPRGHDFKDGFVNVQVTCQKDGTVTYTCKNIDQTMEYEPCKTTHIVTLKHDTMEYSTLVGEYTEKYHNWKEVVEKKPTATEPGIHYFYCTVCGKASKEAAYYANAIVPPTPATTATTKPTTAPKPVTPNKKGVSIPKTNDTTSNLPYVLIAVAFVGLVALVASKRKVNG